MRAHSRSSLSNGGIRGDLCATGVEPDATYVMQGRLEQQSLDIYHLILAATYACNLKCAHCYLPGATNQTLHREVALRLVDEFSQMVLAERGPYGGIFHVKGGEPFVVPYFWDIADKLAELKTLRFMLTTNGTFGGTDVFQRLSDCRAAIEGYLTVVVSLEGPTEETDALLRGPGHFTKVLRFLESLGEYGIDFHLNCVVHTQNIDHLSEYMDLANTYGASQVNFLNLIPKGRGCALHGLLLSHSELYMKLRGLYEDGDAHTRRVLAGSLPDIINRAVCPDHAASGECVAGYRGLFYVTPDGLAFTCPNVNFEEFAVGNVNTQCLGRLADNLGLLRERIRTRSAPFTCTGERLLYEKAENVCSTRSISKFAEALAGFAGSPCASSVSYCFSRNY